jgi:pimeloyl-ACP methyl ester carboxylesterase
MYVRAGAYQLEYLWHGPPPEAAPTLVFLHEGLGCSAMWRDFPLRVAQATGCGVLVYSRAGYGNSEAILLPRPVRYMHDEAHIILPQVLDAVGVRQAILIGHSDGGSIALIYAGSRPDGLVRGLIVEAPHIFVEERTLASIAQAAAGYTNGPLQRRLERYHGVNTDCAFWGWHNVWLDPAFRAWNIAAYLPNISVPVLVIQGENDAYGTLRQVEAIQSGCQGLVQSLILPHCGHSPHRDQPEHTLAAITAFVRHTLGLPATAPSPAGP